MELWFRWKYWSFRGSFWLNLLFRYQLLRQQNYYLLKGQFMHPLEVKNLKMNVRFFEFIFTYSLFYFMKNQLIWKLKEKISDINNFFTSHLFLNKGFWVLMIKSETGFWFPKRWGIIFKTSFLESFLTKFFLTLLFF